MMSLSSEINVTNSLLGLFIDFFIPTEVFHGLLTKELCMLLSSYLKFWISRIGRFLISVCSNHIYAVSVDSRLKKNLVSNWIILCKQRGLCLPCSYGCIEKKSVIFKVFQILYVIKKRQTVRNENGTISVCRQRKPAWFTSWIFYHSSFSLWFGPSVPVIVWQLLASGFRASCRR